MNGDGYTDFLVTAQGDDKALNASNNTNGVAYLIFGRSTGWKDFSLLEPQEYGVEILGAANMNYTWEAMGDVDGDGYDDLSYSTSSATTILYGSEQMTSGANVGVQHVATTTAGTLTANPATTLFSDLDRLIGNAGNDTLIGDGGADVLIGGAGNDLMKVADATFFKLDGGTGIDVVEVTAAATLNFNNITNQRVEAIEVLNLGTGNQSVTLSGMDVLNMTENTNTAINNSTYQKGHVLVVDSSAGTDTVTLNGGWTTTAVTTGQSLTNASFGSGTFSVYQFGSSNIYAVIDDVITKNIS
jgi:Ca2+-binding RTX toxin-like protein